MGYCNFAVKCLLCLYVPSPAVNKAVRPKLQRMSSFDDILSVKSEKNLLYKNAKVGMDASLYFFHFVLYFLYRVLYVEEIHT